MESIIMKALAEGFAGLITSLFDKARKNGLSIILLTVASGGLLWRSLDVESTCEDRVERLETKIEANDIKWSAALNIARNDFLKCDSLRQEQSLRIERQAGQIASLQLEVKYLNSQR